MVLTELVSFVVAALGLAWSFRGRLGALDAAVMRLADRLEERRRVAMPIVLALLCATSYGVLLGFPNSADEYAYVFQADTLRAGRLWNEPHPRPEFFPSAHIALKDGKFLSRFPPGWPMVLAAAGDLGLPYGVVNPLLAACSLVVFYLLARSWCGPRAAWLGILSLIGSAFFLLNGGSYFSHPLSMLATLCFAYFADRGEKTGRAGAGILAGLFIGLAFLTRPYTAVLMAAPVGLCLLADRSRRARLTLFWIFLGALPPLLFLFWYNREITGNPLLMVTTWFDPEEHLGFTKGHTLARGVQQLGEHLLDLIGWGSPALLPLFALLLIGGGRRKERLLYPYLFPALAVGYTFYYLKGGNRYGPRFYFEAYPFVVLYVVAGLTEGRRAFPPAAWRRPLLLLFLAGWLSALVTLPVRAGYEHRAVGERLDLYRLVERERLSNAAVLLKTGTGILRRMPAGDLIRNGLSFDRPVLYAVDRGDENRRLMDFYPGRRFYRYERPPGEVHGRLTLLDRVL